MLIVILYITCLTETGDKTEPKMDLSWADQAFQQPEAFIEAINKEQSSWKAAYYPQFENQTIRQMLRRAGGEQSAVISVSHHFCSSCSLDSIIYMISTSLFQSLSRTLATYVAFSLFLSLSLSHSLSLIFAVQEYHMFTHMLPTSLFSTAYLAPSLCSFMRQSQTAIILNLNSITHFSLGFFFCGFIFSFFTLRMQARSLSLVYLVFQDYNTSSSRLTSLSSKT